MQVAFRMKTNATILAVPCVASQRSWGANIVLAGESRSVSRKGHSFVKKLRQAQRKGRKVLLTTKYNLVSPHFVLHKMISEGLSAFCLHNSYFILSAGGSPHFARGKMIFRDNGQ
jgi:hypothetical protein